MTLPDRFSGEMPPEFSSPLIDRHRPVAFRLDGRRIAAWEGDTVLSALLANGIAAVGQAEGSPLALDAFTAPAVTVAGNEGRPDLAMPMALCPAMNGVSLVTMGSRPMTRPGLFRALASRPSTLGLAGADRGAGGWIDAPPTRPMTTDLVVVGGGVAGLSAALAAAERGWHVCVLDREFVLGGASVFFGRADGEPAPEDLIGSLADRIGASGLITLLPGTGAFAVSGTTLRAIRVVKTGGLPAPEHITIAARAIVLAVGTASRLPIFPGNRLPGVMDALSAWRLAARYQVWPGQTAHVHSATNAGYRMALLGAAAGKSIERTSDPRPAPQTRFIEFCKAYGHRLGWGAAIGSVEPERSGTLRVALVDSQTGAAMAEPISCDRLIVAGGWQPELDLWARAGGRVRWDADAARLVAEGTVPGLHLAGSAAGYLSLVGCRDHGRAVVEAIFEGGAARVPDPRIDPVYETPDASPLPRLPASRRQPPAWVSPPCTTHLPVPRARGLAGLLDFKPREPALAARAQTIADVAGLVVAGRLSPQFVPRFAAERCIVPTTIVAAAAHRPGPVRVAPDAVPAYLAHRFGPAQRRRRLVPEAARMFEPGALIFLNTDEKSPLAAIGVVLAATEKGFDALLADDGLGSEDIVYVRDGVSAFPARLQPPAP